MIEALKKAAGAAYEPLTDRETMQLIRMARRGGEAGRSASNTLIERNILLILKQVRRYTPFRTSTVTEDDFLQAALIGFQNAIRLYDPTRKSKFGTYAVHAMRRHIRRVIENGGEGLRTPVHLHRRLRQIRMAAADIRARGDGQPPSEAEIAQAANLTPAQVSTALSLPVMAFSLDEDREGFEEAPMGEYVGSDEEWHSYRISPRSRRELASLLEEVLNPNQTRIVRLYFGLDDSHPSGLSTSEIAAMLGCRKQNVQQILQRALQTMRCPMNAQRLSRILTPLEDIIT